MSSGHIRKPAVAGPMSFYPSDPDRLREKVTGFIDAADVEPAPDHVEAIVAPHAGYDYSGATAGFAYARIKGKTPGRIVLMGCSHRAFIDSAAVYAAGAFETPVGTFPVDEAFAQDLVREVGAVDSVEPHLDEHSLEVQLPFLSVAVGQAPIVPILFGGRSLAWHAEFGAALSSKLEDGDLVVASTDLSHFLSESEANAVDKRSLDTLMTQDWARFADSIVSGESSMCGSTAVTTTMAYAVARDAKVWRVLDYSTSAKTTGDLSRVVGYASVSMEREA